MHHEQTKRAEQADPLPLPARLALHFSDLFDFSTWR
jgi:hypothetical protein